MEERYKIRPINPDSIAEIELVATRMRQTLVEVISEEVGGSMYSMEWLVDRVKFHLNPKLCDGQVFLAVSESGEIVGHTIVRVESETEDSVECRVESEDRGEQPTDNQQPKTNMNRFGLFSTFYVVPEHREKGIATKFIETGEEWMRSKGLPKARTYTAEINEPLHQLMFRHGYEIELRKNEMVSLVKALFGSARA